MNEMTKTIIVGGVAGGAGAAARLRRNDESARIILLEKGEYISFANCGLPYYVGKTIKEREKLLLQTPKNFKAQFNVDVRVKNECLSVDTINKTLTIKDLNTNKTYTESYDKLILSPGARPTIPNIDGIERAFTLRNIPDAEAINQFVEKQKAKTCTIIGGGFIGLEMAENLVQRGLEVSVIEATPHILGMLDTDMTYDVQNYIRSKGIKLFLNSKVVSLDQHKVKLANQQEIDADIVILSIGVTPETSFLEGTGIVLGKRGEIIVNEYLETSQANVYAVGDAISSKSIITGKNALVPLASPANKQARIVADNVCGMARKYLGTQGTAIIKFFDLTVALTGENERSLQNNSIPYLKSITHSPSHAGYYPGSQMMTIKILFSPHNGRLLGAAVCGGKGADKRIDTLATALRAGMSVMDLQEIEFAYAPPFSSAKDPVNVAGYVAENIKNKTLQPVYVEELDGLQSNVLLVDVRTVREFEKGSIPRAINIPLQQLRERLHELDRTRNIVVICQIGQRGYNAEQILRQKGFRVKNLIGGYRMYQAYLRDKYESL